MSIQFRCRSCNKRVQAPDSAAGKSAPCPLCGQVIEVPLLKADGDEIDPLEGLEEFMAAYDAQRASGANPSPASQDATTARPSSSFPHITVDATDALKKLRQNVQNTPPVLRAMKVATVLWILAMVLNGVLIFVGRLHSAIDLGNGVYLKDWNSGPSSYSDILGMALAAALYGAPWLSSYFYVPTMIVLFVFWFADSKSTEKIGLQKTGERSDTRG